MLGRSYVIRREISKYALGKAQSIYAVELICLRGNLHNDRLYSRVAHVGKCTCKLKRIRRRICRRTQASAVSDSTGADYAGPASRRLKTRSDKLGGRALSLGSGNTDKAKRCRRLSVKALRDHCKSTACRRNNGDRRILRKIERTLGKEATAAALVRTRRKIVTVAPCAGYADEKTAAPRTARIGSKRGNLDIGIGHCLCARCCNNIASVKQPAQLHFFGTPFFCLYPFHVR